jgi:periplasmic protein TonB
MSPKEEILISNSFEDIVFSNRNKAYGAYVLRKKERRYLLAAFFISLFTVSSFALIPLISNYFSGNSPDRNGPVTVIATMDTSLDIKPPEPPQLKVEELVKTERFVPPIFVDSVQHPDAELYDIADLLDHNTSLDPPSTIEAAVEEDPAIIPEEKPFITVEVPATFDGGNLNSFNRWVLQNIKYPQIPAENGISGKVYIQFVVNSKGKVEDVKVLRGADPALDQEAMRVIESSPKWTPPMQGGRPVKQLFSLPVVFKLSE